MYLATAVFWNNRALCAHPLRGLVGARRKAHPTQVVARIQLSAGRPCERCCSSHPQISLTVTVVRHIAFAMVLFSTN